MKNYEPKIEIKKDKTALQILFYMCLKRDEMSHIFIIL